MGIKALWSRNKLSFAQSSMTRSCFHTSQPRERTALVPFPHTEFRIGVRRRNQSHPLARDDCAACAVNNDGHKRRTKTGFITVEKTLKDNKRRSEEARVSEEAVKRKGGGAGPRELGTSQG